MQKKLIFFLTFFVFNFFTTSSFAISTNYPILNQEIVFYSRPISTNEIMSYSITSIKPASHQKAVRHYQAFNLNQKLIYSDRVTFNLTTGEIESATIIDKESDKNEIVKYFIENQADHVMIQKSKNGSLFIHQIQPRTPFYLAELAPILIPGLNFQNNSQITFKAYALKVNDWTEMYVKKIKQEKIKITSSQTIETTMYEMGVTGITGNLVPKFYYWFSKENPFILVKYNGPRENQSRISIQMTKEIPAN